MDLIIKEFDVVYGQKINQILDEYRKLEQLNEQSLIDLHLLKEENIALKKRISELNDEKKSKSSSVLWETTQKQLGEKDQIIEQLKRQSGKTTVTDKYPYNPNLNSIPNQSNQSNQNIKKTESVIETEQKQESEPDEEQLVETVEKTKKKDKSEKKKKKKEKAKIIEDDEEDIEKLERELMGLV